LNPQEPSGAGESRGPGRIIITGDDLGSDTPPPSPGAPGRTPLAATVPPPPASVAALPPIAGGSLPSAERAVGVRLGTGGSRSFARHPLGVALLAGAIGGALGTVAGEVLRSPGDVEVFRLEAEQLRVKTGIWVAIIGGVLGFVLRAWEGFSSGVAARGWRDGAVGALVGTAAGFVGGWTAEWTFQEMLRSLDPFESAGALENRLRLSRSLAWGFFGLCLGGGLGVSGGTKKVVNGLIGGAVGGVLGGLAFQEIAFSSTDPDAGLMLRLVGMTITAVGIAVGVGLVEHLRRDAWVSIVSGPMAGKEYILYNDEMVLGSDHRNDVVLVKDPAVLVNHAAIQRDPAGRCTLVASPGALVWVNGHQVSRQRLAAGDELTLGATTMSYQERVSR
jgi:hypothetical protein